MTFSDVLKNSDYPFIKAVENTAKPADASRSPVFQTMFFWQQNPLKELSGLAAWGQGDEPVKLELGKLKLESEKIEQGFSQFDLSLIIAENDGEYRAAMQYNSDLFKPQTIERMSENFNKLLTSIVENPQKSIAEIDLLSDKEFEKVVFDWNKTAQNRRQDDTIHRLFEERAKINSQKIALTVGKKSLTYEQLNEQANRFANFLKANGIGSEDRVAVCLNRSENMIIALLGILKSGAAYVPLDATYPKNRLSLMLEDSRAKAVITETGLLSFVPVSDSKIINFDEIRNELPNFDKENPALNISSRNLAYVIYTSGSTGKPTTRSGSLCRASSRPARPSTRRPAAPS